MKSLGLAAGLLLLSAGAAHAHFQQLLPSTDRFGPQDDELTLDLVFTHPMDMGPAMEMARPERFGVLADGEIRDLLDTLEQTSVDGATAWTAAYAPEGPDNLVFFVEPVPYWEPAEGKSIIHYTKVIVDAYDLGEGWDEPIGLPVEIAPLVRPYGLWAGNVFSGIVLKDGEPVPFAEVEVEWANDGSVTPLGDAFVTQLVKADGNGVFHYGLPRAGWWGFAALVDADFEIADPEGTPQPVELGGLIWVHVESMD